MNSRNIILKEREKWQNREIKKKRVGDFNTFFSIIDRKSSKDTEDLNKNLKTLPSNIYLRLNSTIADYLFFKSTQIGEENIDLCIYRPLIYD